MVEATIINTELARSLYRGFTIGEPRGNNAFSYEERKHKEIYIPPFIEGTLDDLEVGEEFVFNEIVDGVEQNKKGLKNFIYFSKNDKDIFIFDNHNHAFFFWFLAYAHQRFNKGTTLVHVDQHKDTRAPDELFDSKEGLNFQNVFLYTNFKLNVGNFIEPAKQFGLFSQVQQVVSEKDFMNPIPENFVLDLDMDIFSEDMDYIKESLKQEKLQSYIEKTNVITIATSPFFMDQEKAISLIKDLLGRI